MPFPLRAPADPRRLPILAAPPCRDLAADFESRRSLPRGVVRRGVCEMVWCGARANEAFVAEGVVRAQNAGEAELGDGFGIVGLAGQRVRDAPELAGGIAEELVAVSCGLAFAGAQLGRIRPRPARTQRSVHHADAPVHLLGQLRQGGDELGEDLGEDALQRADRPRDGRLVDEQQLGDHLFGDVSLEVHDSRFYRLAECELPWPANSDVPDDASFDTLNQLIEFASQSIP